MPEATRSLSDPFHALIVGGGVAALEGALALRELGGESIATTLIAPTSDFVYRPMSVRAPFGFFGARSYPLDSIASELGVELCSDSMQRLDPEARVVHTKAGAELAYDALLLAPGAAGHARFDHAITIDDRRLDELLHGLVQDIEGGYSQSIAFVVPGRMAWPLPIYELALMTAGRAFDMNVRPSITIATPEETPLAAFGLGISDGLRQLLEENGIAIITSAHCEVPEPGLITISPGSRELRVDRIVALPELSGPSLPGVSSDQDGFIPIDARSEVRGLEHVYAAGDATDFPVKHGGIAAQQADVAAQAIAAIAGHGVAPPPLHPVIHGMLLTGDKPRYLAAHIHGGDSSSSQMTDAPTWSPRTKIAARYLAPYLEERDRQLVETP